MDLMPLELNFTPFPNLDIERLLLRQLTMTDDNEIFALHSNERNRKYLLRPKPKSIDVALKFIYKINDGITKNNQILWGILFKDDKKLMGTITLWNISKDNFRAAFGYELHPEFQRQGIMQEALEIVLDYGFNIMKLHSIEAEVSPKNEPSIKRLERNDFIREAYFKEDIYYNGKFLDTAIYTLLNSN